MSHDLTTFERELPDGGSIRIHFLNGQTARIQLCPKKREPEESTLNRYGFIQESPAPIRVQLQETAQTVTLTAGELHLSCDLSRGLVSARNNERHLLQMTAARFSRDSASVEFAAIPDEDWIGFGDQTRERLYHRGHTAVCDVSNVASYIPVPFFMSTQGYGILVNTTHRTVFDLCRNRPDSFGWRDRRGVIDFYLFAAPTFKELIRLYTGLTGRPKLPPEWAFGLWYICRMQANDAEVVNDALNLRREGIPCDLIGLEPGWMEKHYDLSVEKNWSSERFPLPEWQKNCRHTFIQALKRMGFKLELWLCNDYDLSYEEERRLDKQAVSAAAETAVFHEGAEQDRHFAEPVRFDRITRPDEPWFEHLKQFVDWGADLFKQDGAFQVCSHPDRLFGNGMTDAEMHNLYVLCYSRQMWEGFADHTNRRPVVFTPAGWTGFQAWAGTWTGDTGGRLDTLGAMLNTALMGHSWLTNDMEVAEKEGIHFGYLLPWSQINSWSYFRMPWVQGTELSAMHRFYSRFRSRLIPYLYSWARQATLTSEPLLRPLTLEFQQDRNCRNVLHEYLLGRDLLVGIYRNELYFPPGRWKDAWSGEVVEGGRALPVTWPADRGGALYCREGAIIPFGPVMQFRGEKPLDQIELYLFPGTNVSEFELYEDDGVSFDYQKGCCHVTPIRMEQTERELSIRIGPSPAESARRWSLRIALDHPPQAIGAGMEWNEERRELTVAEAGPGEFRLLLR